MTVYYLCEWTGPSGGIRVLYDHVRVLRELGFDAALGARGAFERCVWFEHRAEEIPGVDGVRARVGSADLVVLPEIVLGQGDFVAPCAVAAFVQNLTLVPPRVDWSRFRFVMAASEPVAVALEPLVAGRAPIRAVPHFLSADLLRPPRAWAPIPRPRLLLNPRRDKHRNEPWLAARALEDSGFAVDVVDRPCHRRDYVRLFEEHQLYLHLNRAEGFPGPVIEAFGAGCLVVGFAGGGGRELMCDEVNCLLAEDGDWRAAVALAKSTLRRPAAELSSLLSAARATAASYDEDRFRRRLAEMFASERRA